MATLKPKTSACLWIKTEKNEQLGRYLDSLGNLILTDYLEFRWYVEGQHRLTAKLASVNGKGLVAGPTGAPDLTMLLQGFINMTAPTIGSPEALAKKMAALAQQHHLRHVRRPHEPQLHPAV